jgi:hypothetical protein
MRTGLRLLLTPLAQKDVKWIADNARSREDFHDYNKIMDPPNFGECLCALRIISGTKCAKFFKKTATGGCHPDANDHWVWQIDIAPNRMVCPIAKQRYLGKAYRHPCKILIKAPPAEWVLQHHPDDLAGVVAGRIATEDFRRGELCIKCQLKETNAKINITAANEWEEDQSYKLKFKELLYPPDDVRDWPEGEYIQPVKYQPESGFSRFPTLVPNQPYILHELQYVLDIDLKDIFITDAGLNLPDYKADLIRRAEDAEALETRLSEEESKRANKMLADKERIEEQRKKAEAYAATQDTAQWHTLRKPYFVPVSH